MPTNVKRHFVGVSETGELLDDPKAFAIEEELMSDKYGMASPDTPAVPYLIRLTWDHDLRRTGWRYVMLSVSIGSDSAWLFRQAYAIWKAAHTSVRGRGGAGWMTEGKLGAYALAASIICFFVVVIRATGGEAPPPVIPEPTPAVREARIDTPDRDIFIRGEDRP